MKSEKLTAGLFAFYFLALTWIILFKMQFSWRDLPHLQGINLIPFGASLVVNGRMNLGEIIQNALAFVPFGIFMRVLLQKKPLAMQLVPIVAASLLFEAAQYVFAIGASDITDVLSNTAGGLAGLAVAAVLEKICARRWVKTINILCLAGAVILSVFIAILLLENL